MFRSMSILVLLLVGFGVCSPQKVAENQSPPPPSVFRNGLTAEYSSGTAYCAAEIDPNINFTWSASNPPAGGAVPLSNFGVRWSGYITFPVSGTVVVSGGTQFFINSISGSYYYSGGQYSFAETWTSTNVQAGTRYPFIAYYGTSGSMHEAPYVGWSYTGQSGQAVPTTAFTPAVIPSAPTGVNTTNGSGNVLNINWTPPTSGSAPYGYFAYATVGAFDYTSPVNSAPYTGTSNTIPDSNILSGPTYSFTVRTVYNSPVTGDYTKSSPTTPATGSIPAYLQSLVIPNDALVGSGTTTATATMNFPVMSATTITLTSSDANASVPSSVTIPAGAASATFNVTVTATSPPARSKIYASLGTWRQKATVVAISDSSILQVTGATAVAGTDGVWLSWNPLPDGVVGSSYAGYVVERRISGGQYSSLFSKPVNSTMFVDDTGIAGTSYVYRIDLLNSAGTIVSSSSESTVGFPSGSNQVTWSQSYGSLSGTVTLSATAPSAACYALYANGKLVATSPQDNTSSGSTVTCNFCTNNLANGTYSLELASDGTDGNYYSSAPQTITISNDLSAVSDDGFIETSTGDYSGFYAILPSDTATYTAQLSDDAGNTVASWAGNGTALQFAWDGSGTADGTVLSLNVQCVNATGSVKNPPYAFPPVTKLTRDPTFLAFTMTRPLTPSSIQYGKNYRIAVMQALYSLKQLNSSMTYSVFEYTEHVDLPAPLIQATKRWLGTSVVDFYLEGHATPYINPISSAHQEVWLGNKAIANFSTGLSTINIPDIVPASHAYNFVWLDCCATGGYDNNLDPYMHMSEHPVQIWSSVFHTTSYVGWNGYDLLSIQGTAPNTYECDWGKFRHAFWTLVGNGTETEDVANLFYYAMSGGWGYQNDCSFYPWSFGTFSDGNQAPKWILAGDTILP